MKILLTLCALGLTVLLSNVMDVEAKIKLVKCPEGFQQSKKPRKVCDTCQPPVPIAPLGSLIFVLDSTNSMSPSIDALKEHITGLVRANTIFRNFVINHFNDPYEKNLKVSTSAKEIEQYLEEIMVFGGGDCPEPSLAASIDALAAAHDNSLLVLVTDANPKDAHLKMELLQLLRKKKSRMYVTIVGDLCHGDSSSEIKYNGEYEYLAIRSVGKVANVEKPTAMKNMMSYFESVLKGKMSLEAFPKTKEELAKSLIGKCVCRWEYDCVKIPPPPPPVKPKNPCKDDEYAVKKDCDCPKPPPKKVDVGSLIFVIDTTASMDDTIEQVKNGVLATVAANKLFKNYVVVTYNDPQGEGPDKSLEDKLKTTSARKLHSLLGQTMADFGEDCPEPSMKAMKHASEMADDHSTLFLFTDATAKDYNKVREVIDIMKRKHIVPYIVIVGNLCEEEKAEFPYHGEYETLAKETGGQVLKYGNDKSVAKVMEFIQKAVAQQISFHSIGSNEADLNNALAGQCCKIECVPKAKCPGGSRLVSVMDLKTKTSTEHCLCSDNQLINLRGKCTPCR